MPDDESDRLSEGSEGGPSRAIRDDEEEQMSVKAGAGVGCDMDEEVIVGMFLYMSSALICRDVHGMKGACGDVVYYVIIVVAGSGRGRVAQHVD